jgi:DNA-binding MarR family transcriptional regulator
VALIDEAMTRQVKTEQRLVERLGPRQLTRSAALLRALLVEVESNLHRRHIGPEGADDAIQKSLDEWQRARPDLDLRAKAVTSRITRLAALFDSIIREELMKIGLTLGEFPVIGALRRSGAPFQLPPSALARDIALTSGGMTAAIDKVERKGLVIRAPNPDDRRGSLVRLTDEGRRVIDEALTRYTQIELALVKGIEATERDQLSDLLRFVLVGFDPA